MPDTTNAPVTKSALCHEIRRFLATRPGFDYANYGDMASYRADSRRATQQRNDAEIMLARIERDDATTLQMMLTQLPDRLTFSSNGQLHYTAGQYYCTEYRGAVARWLASVLWAYFRDLCKCDTGDKIRSAARREFRQRSVRGYFS